MKRCIEEVHSLRRYNSPRTHRAFLAHLRAVLPPTCAPILITDAGFRGPWFREVERYGWDWVGRVRNRVKYRLARDATSIPGGAWADTKGLYGAATPRPRYLGRAELSRRQSYACALYLVRQLRCTSCGSIVGAPAGRARRTDRAPRRGAVAGCTKTRGCSRRRCRTRAVRRAGW